MIPAFLYDGCFQLGIVLLTCDRRIHLFAVSSYCDVSNVLCVFVIFIINREAIALAALYLGSTYVSKRARTACLERFFAALCSYIESLFSPLRYLRERLILCLRAVR